jgi:hypothetical protein
VLTPAQERRRIASLFPSEEDNCDSLAGNARAKTLE